MPTPHADMDETEAVCTHHRSNRQTIFSSRPSEHQVGQANIPHGRSGYKSRVVPCRPPHHPYRWNIEEADEVNVDVHFGGAKTSCFT
jgi:hypothetical protein